jgi:SLT domain-containing protein
MANWWDSAPVVAKQSPLDAALSAEGVTGPVADIARSIYEQESGSGKNTKTSNAGAVGGMQVIPATFNRMADKGWAIDDPVHNARAGVRYIKALHQQAGGDPALTAAGYYGGEGGLEKARKGVAVADPRNPNAPTTLEYGKQVAARLPASAPAAGGEWWADAPVVTEKAAPAAPLKPMEANPTEGNSFLQNAAAGAGKFVADTGTGISKLSADIFAKSPLIPIQAIGAGIQKITGRSAQQVADKLSSDIKETRKLDAPLMDTGGGMAGYFAGGAATAPLMPATSTVGGAATLGGAVGLTQPAVDWRERGTNALIGAAAGGAGQAAMNGLARVVKPNTSPQINALMKEGVTPTPGQILGGSFKRVEDGLTSVPIVGDAIKSGQRRAAADLNTAAMNRALAPIDMKLPKGLQGREAVDYVGTTLGAKYDALLPKLSTQADDVFAADVKSLRALVDNGNMGEAEAKQFGKILQNQVLGKFKGQNSVTGETIKSIDGELGRVASKYMSDPSADKRQLGEAIIELQGSLRSLIQRTNPDYAKELKSINAGYANFKRVQRAAAGLGAEDGIFSPAQLQNAVKALDRSKDKGQFAKGNALMQDLSEAGKSALGGSVPDSGTPYRLATTLGASGGAGAFLGMPAALGMLTAPLAYSRPGQNALAAALTSRPQGANELANFLRLTGAGVAGGSGAIAVQK